MNRSQRRAAGITRRDFMKTMAVIGAAAGTTGLLQSCGNSSSGGSSSMEKKTLYFDYSHLNPDNHDFYVVVGNKFIPLSKTKKEDIDKAKSTNSFLKAIPDEFITHIVADLELPSNNAQLCYIRTAPKGQPHNSPLWKMAGMFLHFPKTSIEKSLKRQTKSSSLSAKAKFYNIDYKASSTKALIDESLLINAVDTANSIVFSTPEIMSLDADSGAHISNNIINQQASTVMFSQAIMAQGSDWTTYQILTDPSTGKPYTDSKGATMKMPVYSDLTLTYGSSAVIDSAYAVKQDASLYGNISNVSDPSQMQGKICTVQNGITYTDLNSPTLNKRLKDGQIGYSLSDVCTGGGYKLELDDVEQDGSNVLATFNCTNSYIRHLGMYVQYLDIQGSPIPISSIPSSFFQQYSDYFYGSKQYDTSYGKCLKIIGPEYVVFGVPVHKVKDDVKVAMPGNATGFQIIGNTLGHGRDEYSDLKVGVVLTAVFNLAVPSLFLAMGVGSTYSAWAEAETAEMTLEVLEVFIDIFATIIEAVESNDAKAFIQLGVNLGQKLLMMLTKKIAELGAFAISLLSALGTGEGVDAIPIVGAIMNGIACATIASQLTQTSIQCLRSPWNYVKTLSVSHNISITINHDPKNPEGFPSVATHYVVTATCVKLDSKGNVIYSSTPIQTTQQMQATTRTAPIVVNMNNVPFGGFIALSVGFYSNTGWLAGYASLKDGDNSQSSFSLTITQNQVPLTANTYYSHKEKMTLDASGSPVWTATTTPPAPTPIGQCGQTAGQLCQIINITDSNTFASVGYSWQAYSQGSSGQMYYFGNVSTTDTPQSSSLVSQPLRAQTRIVYDLMGGSKCQRNFYLDVASGNILRQIRLSLQGKPAYDAPNSNIAWGKLNFSSDSMLLHPNNMIVSINANLSMIEVLRLPLFSKTDANAPVAAVYAGKGIREGLLDGPLCAALTPKGEIMILETANNRLQAFDTGGNPIKIFNGKTSYFAPLKYPASQYKYIDMATEYTGYIYLLSYMLAGSAYQFYLDIYTPDGAFLSRTSNFSAAKIAVSYWRDVFAANLEALKLPNGSLPTITEPSISRWIPSTP